jgi:cobalt-zinc-cadmium efflux system membrane fusion protein
VWVIGRVYEQQVAQVAPGMNATLTLNAYPGRTWTGTVDFVGATLDESTRTLPIRVELDNPDGLLRPGLFGSLRLASGQPTSTSVVVPLSAVQTVDNRTVVFVPGHEDGEFAAHPVTTGRENPRQVEVLEGLEPGARIVVEGAFILKSELMRGELGHGHAH